MKIKLVVLLIGTFSLAACGGGKRVDVNVASVSAIKPGVVSLGANWLKDKGDKFDFQLKIKNEYKDNIIIKLAEISCARGGVSGQVKHTFFNTGERTIDFGLGEMKTNNLVCDIGSKQAGDYSITVKRVFANPARDGKTPGEILANDVQLVVKR